MTKKFDDNLFEDVEYTEPSDMQDDLFEDVEYDENQVMDVALDSGDEEKASMKESLGRGAVQGATFGFGEELGSAALAPLASLYEAVSEQISGTPENIDKQLREQGFTGDVEETDIIDKYKALRDTTREANLKAQQDNPNTYLAGELVGGIAPAIATGGGAAAAKVGTELSKQALKEGAKLGGKYGAASGLGYSEAEDVEGMLEDTAIGAGVGAGAGVALPVLGQGAKRMGGEALGKLKSGLSAIIPESESIKAGYTYGKQGRQLAEEFVDEDMKKLAASVLDRIKKAKESNNLESIKQELDDVGIKVDAKKTIEEAIDDLQKIVVDDVENLTDKSVYDKIRSLTGTGNIQEEKMLNRAEKSALKKSLESQGKEQEAIISGEKKLAKEAFEGKDLQSIQDLKRKMDDLEIPFDTSEGQFSGVKGKFNVETPEGEIIQQSRTYLKDTTPYQPEISSVLGPDGRPIIRTTDLGSGKVSAMVGDIEKRLAADLENLTVSEIESMRNKINIITKLAKGQGRQADPIIGRARKLASELKRITDKAIENSGETDLIRSRQRMSDLLSAEDLLGVSETKAIESGARRSEQVRNIADKLGFYKGFKTRDEVAEATEKLGKDVLSGADQEQFKLYKELNSLLGRESQESATKAGLYKKLAGKIPNVAGRAVNKVGQVAKPVIDAKKAITGMTDDQLTNSANKMLASDNKSLQSIGNRIIEAVNSEGTAKQQLLWSLSQSPAMREFIKREALDVNELEEEILNYEEEPQVEMQEEFQSPQYFEESEQTREPSSVSAVLEELAEGEGTSDQQAQKQGYDSGYDVTLGYGAYDPEGFDKPISQMTLAELDEFQTGMLNNPKNKLNSSAVGKYQIVRKTLRELKNKLKLSDDTLFDAETQDTLARELMKRRGYDKYLKGDMTEEQLQENFSKEWASVYSPSKKGSYYGGQKVGTTTEEIQEALTQPEEVESIEKDIDQINKMQSSGDTTPVDEIDDLLGKLNRLNISEEDINELENEAVEMNTYSQGLALKEKIRKLTGV